MIIAWQPGYAGFYCILINAKKASEIAEQEDQKLNFLERAEQAKLLQVFRLVPNGNLEWDKRIKKGQMAFKLMEGDSHIIKIQNYTYTKDDVSNYYNRILQNLMDAEEEEGNLLNDIDLKKRADFLQKDIQLASRTYSWGEDIVHSEWHSKEATKVFIEQKMNALMGLRKVFGKRNLANEIKEADRVLASGRYVLAHDFGFAKESRLKPDDLRRLFYKTEIFRGENKQAKMDLFWDRYEGDGFFRATEAWVENYDPVLDTYIVSSKDMIVLREFFPSEGEKVKIGRFIFTEQSDKAMNSGPVVST